MKPELRAALAEKGRCDLPSVLLAAAECAPLAKTGGLADVVGTLPKSLAALGFDARIITPYHRVIKEKYASQVTHLTDFYIDLGWRHQYVGIERLLLDGIVIYLVDNEFYFGDRIYRGGEAEGEQYAFFARAILEALPRLDFTPEILHCNDWHTAVLPMLMKTQYAGRMQSRMQTLLTIHNIAYQGKFSFEFIQDLLGIDARYYTPEFMELNGCANLLKAGCVFADHINTVSPSYAGEIRTAAYGEGLEGILNARQHQLSGILNGIDTAVFDPAHDGGIAAPYSADDLSGKAACRAALCRELGLEIGAHTPIVAMVTRMTPQKGFDLVQCVLDELMNEQDMAFVLLGTGNAEYEDFMRSAEWRHKGRLCAYIGYDEALSHRVYAGSDFLLMPSSFEPCGLSQMIAMRYGTLPIVRETGGLRDSVQPYNRFTGEGTGFSFANFNAYELADTIRRALALYHSDHDAYCRVQRQAMSQDFSFTRSAEDYAHLYLLLLPEDTAPKHDAADEAFRSPIGAVETGASVRLAFADTEALVFDAAVEIYGDAYSDTVAMTQTARLVGVLLFFPYWIQFVTRHEPKTAPVTEEKPLDAAHTSLDRLISTRSSRIVFTLLLSIGLGYLGNASGLPAASMVFPMIAVAALNCTTSVCAVPLAIKNIAQLLAGSLVGVSITAATFSSLSSTLVPVGLLLLSYWTVNGLYSGICKRTKLLDLKSAMFASAPGGATDMSLIAADLGADLSQIALIQVLRAAYVVAVMPPLILGFIQWIG